MTTILTSIDHPNVILPNKDMTVYDYYIGTIQPYLVQRGYQVEYQPCEQVWDTLLQQTTDVFLMFLMTNIQWEDSCCVNLARRIYREWPLGNDPPIRILHFEWEDSDDLAEITAAYQIPRPKEPIYNYVIDRSHWDAEYIADWIDIYLTQHSYDERLLIEQLQALLSHLDTSWSLFNLVNLAYYYLVHIKIETQPQDEILSLIWDREQTLHPLEGGLSQFVALVDTSDLQLIFHLEEMLTLFNNALKKHIIRGVRSPDEVIPKGLGGLPPQFREDEYVTYGDLIPSVKRDLLRHYSSKISTPMTWHNEQEQQARFWTIDASTSVLEEWILIQREDRLIVQSEPQGPISPEEFGTCLDYIKIPDQYFPGSILISDKPFVPSKLSQ